MLDDEAFSKLKELLERQPDAAVDDVEFSTGPHPNWPDRVGIFLENKNTSRGVIANVRVKGSSTLTVQSALDDKLRLRWPLNFEVRVPPGGSVVVGFQSFPLWALVDMKAVGNWVQIDEVAQTYDVRGAYYHSVPFPPFNEYAENFLFYYHAPVINSSDYRQVPLTMNLHPTRDIEMVRYEIRTGNQTEYFGEVPVVAGSQNFHQPQNSSFNLRVTNAKFTS